LRLRAAGALWAAPAAPKDVKLAVAPITAQVESAVRSVEHVTRYLRPKHEVFP